MRVTPALLLSLVLWCSFVQGQTGTVLTYDDPQLNEMSGLACSYRNPGQFWAHNDSGDAPQLFRLDSQGAVLGRVHIDNANAFDWEDIASFRNPDNSASLIVADIGDNLGLRPFVDAYLIADPEDGATTAELLRRYTLVYPDGARDAEALAVDSQERFVYILSKRELHPRLYRFSLDALPGTFVPLNYLGEIRSLPSREIHATLTARKGWNFSPTAMAFSPQMDAAIVATPRHSYYFPRAQGEDWLEALNRDPIILRDINLKQTEAASFGCDGSRIFLGSEGRSAKVRRLSRPH